MTRKRALTMLAAGVFTAVALWLSVRNVAWREIGSAFVNARYAWVAAAVANSLLATYFLGFRWRILLEPRARVSLGRLFRFNVVGQYANILMPARVNEAVRTWMLSREAGVPAGFALGTIAIEKFFDLAIFMAVWVAAPALFAGRPAAIPPAIAFVSGGLAVAVLAAVVLRPAACLRAARFALRLLPGGLREKADRFTACALEAFAALRDPKAAAAVVGLSLGLLAFQVLTMLILARAMGMDVPVSAALFVLLIRGLGDLPPAAPGRIGLFEYSVIVPLSVFGIARTPALGYAVMLHLVTQVPKVLLGGAFLGFRGRPRETGEIGAR